MKVEFTHPDFPDGMEFAMGGLLLVNGESVDISEEAVAVFEQQSGHPLSKANNPFLKISGKKSEGGDS